jgi:ubiquinone/menaquinone biosynthesis C-methylase UbiE
MINQAKKLNNEAIKTGFVDLIIADIEKMPFWEETFTKICTVNTIYFWKNPDLALKEVHRVLMTNGYFIIAFRPYIEGKSLDFSKYGFKEYKMEDVDQLIEETNFKIVEKKSIMEPTLHANGHMHELTSQYYVLQKKPA